MLSRILQNDKQIIFVFIATIISLSEIALYFFFTANEKIIKKLVINSTIALIICSDFPIAFLSLKRSDNGLNENGSIPVQFRVIVTLIII